ncbi:uncharacterized protein LOC130510091 [Raphanus sativus]|uniref:Uncharacterized protein LOC130510091 n=1 Tax=Raphanus sativus TaxID=3726 RepID=A0A9W3DET6_RAPSA|nr:uncharacterized protein LOC130510091 [Raphanus sativus]
MKKKKPKKSPTKASPSSTSKSPPKSAKASSQTKSISDEKVLPESDPTIVSDARLDPVAVPVAQQSSETVDLDTHQSVIPTPETVIAVKSADPSPVCVDTDTTNKESSSGGKDLSSSETALEKEPRLQTDISSGEMLEVANADAKVLTLSSQDAESAPLLAPLADRVTEKMKNKPVPGDEINAVPAEAPAPPQNKTSEDTWCAHARGKRLSRKGEAFTLPTGEACIMIPNSVIEKNRKSWEPFVLGQFYSDPPSQGTLHNIVNGIWSRNYRDIAVSIMEGFAFLFRIPNAATRHRVITQRLWQIEGQTMFVDKWEPGVVPSKPELKSAPIWLELRNVPLQFFNEDGLERIAGLVGHPKFLHPSTANKTNLEVAKVFTIIDPRKPLPEAVNVQFQSGEVSRVLVSSPWMPPVCELCKEVGHVSKRCPSAIKSCSHCNLEGHVYEKCPQNKKSEPKGKKTRRGRSKEKQVWKVVEQSDINKVEIQPPASSEGANLQKEVVHTEVALTSKLGTEKDKVVGESSATPSYLLPVRSKSRSGRSASGISISSHSDIQPDSSDVETSDSDLEEGELSKHDMELGYQIGWLTDDNYGFSPLGKIWLVWHPSLLVTIISKSLQMITAEVTWPSLQTNVFISVVYASNDPKERSLLWSELTDLATSQGMDDKPWLILGDFNQIRDPMEHSLPPTLNMDKRIREFNQCLLDASVEDLNFRGTTFTWWNKRKLAPLAKKLDMSLVNDEWYNIFPSSVAFVGTPGFSDHAVITVVLEPQKIRSKKPFRFYNYLTLNSDFLATVCTNWYSFNVTGSAMYRGHNYSGIEKKTAQAQERLQQAQQAMLSLPSSSNAAIELQAQHEWEELSVAETAFFYQKTSINWLQYGDGNSRLFHRYAASRQAINHIHFLLTDTGDRVETQDGIQALCIDYFHELLGSQVAEPMFIQSDLDLLFDFKCSADEVMSFQKPFSAEDIKDAFFSLPKNKSGGPDGYSSEFFMATWSVVGAEVTEAIFEFFKSGKILKQWNAANLVLIPKKLNAAVTTDFRPISCLNTVYKVIAKLLASRLKEILPAVVSNSQSAFLPGRLLAENVLLATELVNGYNTQALSPRGILKVDLRKAFDCVRWDFLLAALRAIAIPESYICLISECLSTASFSVSVNGATRGFFQSTKGIRQGDPLSPYLFVLAMEGLSRLLLSRYEEGLIGYHPGTVNLKISHLMFADDVMVFFDGTSSSLHGISECLDDFATWSGLQMNPSKTELFTSGIDQTESAAIVSYGFPSGKFPVRYLGLPLMSRKLKISEYAPLVTKITARFQSWSAKILSFAGRLQLLKTVIFGIVSFWLSAFILPKGCIKSIESLCSRFLWSGNIEKRGVAKIAWTTVCLPKDEGGLDLRNFSIWNQMVEASSSDSWVWKKLLDLRPLALQFCKIRLGDGKSASFWYDVWSLFGQLINHIGLSGPRALRVRHNAVVADAINGQNWLLPQPRSQKEVELHIFLTTISLPLSLNENDVYEWHAGDTSLLDFRSSSTWEVLRPREEVKDWVDVVWFKGAVPKLAFTMWVTNLDRLPTRARLAAWGLPVSPTCPLCSTHDETRDHLMLACAFSREVWREVLTRCRSPHAIFTCWAELLSWIRSPTSKKFTLLRKLAVQTVTFHLWKQRNNLVHNQASIPASAVFKGIDKELRNIISARRSRKSFKTIMTMWLR